MMKHSSKPLISVIVTTYNRQELLGKTLAAIINQSYKNIEIIVVDNYSNYNFPDYISSFNDERLTGFQNNNDGIIAVNRNFGVKKATGVYLSFCDDDDIWNQEKLTRQIGEIQRSEKDKLIVHSNCLCFGPAIQSYSTTKKQINSINNLLFGNDISLSTVLVKNSELVRFNEINELRGVEDFYLWLDLVANGYEVILIEDNLVNYYVADQSISRQHMDIANIKYLAALILIRINNRNLKMNNFLFAATAILQIIKFVAKKVLSKSIS